VTSYDQDDASGNAFDDFLRQFNRLVQAALRSAPRTENVFRTRVQEHLGVDPRTLPVVTQSFRRWDHVNLQLALDALLDEPGVEAEVLGIATPHKRHMQVSLSDLLQDAQPMGGLAIGPVDYVKLPSGLHETRSCVDFGLWLVRTPSAPLAAFMHGSSEGHGGGVVLEVVGADERDVDAFHERIRVLMLDHNVFRGQVLSLGSAGEMFGPPSFAIHFHERVALPREAIVMKPGALERIERHTVEMAAMRDALLASGRHLKRGCVAPRSARHRQDADRALPDRKARRPHGAAAHR
jgi:hypothetical protein